jgi:hypothetical protein
MKDLSLLILGVMLVFCIGWLACYIGQAEKYDKESGILFECNLYTSKALNRSYCFFNLTLPTNTTIQYISNFDKLKIMSGKE